MGFLTAWPCILAVRIVPAVKNTNTQDFPEDFRAKERLLAVYSWVRDIHYRVNSLMYHLCH